jgi:phytanoyl-CoA dioxygenase PhyH
LHRVTTDPSEAFFVSPANFLIVARGLFDAQELRSVRAAIDQANASCSADDERARTARTVGVAPDAVRLNRAWYSIWRSARLELFKRRVPQFTQISFPPQIRTIRNLASLVPWHQDSAYMRALGARGHNRVITCFVPLEDSTASRPSVEFSINENQGAVDHLVREGTAINQFDLPDEQKPEPGQVKRFELRLGDAFVFGQDVLHRSYNDGPPSAERTSMEFRIAARDAVIPGKDYYDLERGTWYVA